MSDILAKICATKREHVDLKMRQQPLDDLKVLVKEVPPTRAFINTLKDYKEHDVALIAEVKKASPSKGVIRQDFDPVDIAIQYQAACATCLSVLTDEPYFQGSDDYFIQIRESVGLPLLRKDFMIDEYQIYESRVLGADCILLIMACLSDSQASKFYDLATSLKMDVLVEVHDENELQRALKLKPRMVGVNNRNLKTMQIDLQTGLDLAALIPADILKVAESGIHKNADIQAFQNAGYGAFLVGESLMRQDDIGAAVRNLISIQ